MFDLEYIKDIVKKNILAISSIVFGIVSLCLGIAIVVFGRQNCDEVCTSDDLLAYQEPVKIESVEEEKKSYVKVDVKGAVKSPGVYELESGATVDEAIKLAGGTTSSATTKNINLSKRVTDEMVVYVFSKSELQKQQSQNSVVCEIPKCECESITVNTCTNNDNTNGNSTNSNVAKKISINKSTIEELMTLDGVGEAKAKAIIEYRNANGPFQNLEDIVKVSGISSNMYEKIKDNIEL